MKIFKNSKYFWLFGVAFILNLVWENLHSLLYVQYKGTSITEYILIRAALWDAMVITILLALVLFARWPKWSVFFLAFLIALGLEWWALSTGRWSYNAFMPIIPIFGVGLTPIIQLPLLSYLSSFVVPVEN